MSKPKTSTARGRSFRQRAEAAGLIRREYYASPEHHKRLRALLDKLQGREGHEQ